MAGRMKRCVSLIALSLMLTSCSVLAGPAHTPAPAPSSPAPTQEVTAQPATPSSSPSPTPSPTPSPSPTPTPDPWASHFSASGPWVTVPDWDKGPWDYKDQKLSIDIQKLKLGVSTYFRADIYTRGPLPEGAFAANDSTANHRALPYLIARQNKAIFAITGDYVKNNKSIAGVMIRRGIVFSDKRKRPTVAVMPDYSLKIFPAGAKAADIQAQGVKDAFSFGPVLVQNGKIDPSVAGYYLWPHNWRSAIGMVEPGHYICIVVIEGINLTQLAQLFVDNHCSVAYNLDGGHSSTIVFMGEQLYKQAPGEDNGEQRSLSDLLMIGASDYVPKPTDPVYCNGMGYNVKCRPQPTGGPLGK